MNYGSKKILIIDADFLTKKNHNFQNLASMKISAYYKAKGNIVELLKDYLGEKI